MQLDSLVEVSDSLRPSLDDNTSVETEYNIQEVSHRIMNFNKLLVSRQNILLSLCLLVGL